MNTVVTCSISNAEEVSKRLKNAKIHQVYIKYQTNALFFFPVGVPSNLVTELPIVNYCHK